MKKVYIVLTYTGSLLSKAIKIITNDEYTHTSISFDESLKTMYSFGRKYPRLPIIGGFVTERINEGVYNVFDETYCIVLEYKVNDEEYKKLLDTLEIFKKNKDKYRYNFLGLLTLLFNYSFKRNNYMFCSQFVDSLLKDAGINLVNKSSEFVKPIDFYKNTNLKVIYNGKLKDYNREYKKVSMN